MSAQDLISHFKQSHQAIVNEIDLIQSSAKSYAAIKPHIRDICKILMEHFGRQNSVFFDRLSSFYTADRPCAKIIEFLVYDTKDIKIKVLIFFDKYSGEMGDRGSRTFSKDFTQLAKDVLGRIKTEEEQLLPLLAKMPAEGFS